MRRAYKVVWKYILVYVNVWCRFPRRAQPGARAQCHQQFSAGHVDTGVWRGIHCYVQNKSTDCRLVVAHKNWANFFTTVINYSFLRCISLMNLTTDRLCGPSVTWHTQFFYKPILCWSRWCRVRCTEWDKLSDHNCPFNLQVRMNLENTWPVTMPATSCSLISTPPPDTRCPWGLRISLDSVATDGGLPLPSRLVSQGNHLLIALSIADRNRFWYYRRSM